jgi:hypothetical protein
MVIAIQASEINYFLASKNILFTPSQNVDDHVVGFNLHIIGMAVRAKCTIQNSIITPGTIYVAGIPTGGIFTSKFINAITSNLDGKLLYTISSGEIVLSAQQNGYTLNSLDASTNLTATISFM